MLYVATTIRVRSLFNAALFPALLGETPGATIARIRHMLLAPRR
ncbi:MAG TPA: hypothetical protein VKE74_01495 [Gemmataceae bacterium]|nr:hypothetical protein [Gemmataceae bacterium]